MERDIFKKSSKFLTLGVGVSSRPIMDGLPCKGVSFSGSGSSMELKLDLPEERLSSSCTAKNANAAHPKY